MVTAPTCTLTLTTLICLRTTQTPFHVPTHCNPLVPSSQVQDIKNIFVHDLWATDFDKGRCLGPGYVWLRFGHGGPDYLSMHYNMCVVLKIRLVYGRKG